MSVFCLPGSWTSTGEEPGLLLRWCRYGRKAYSCTSVFGWNVRRLASWRVLLWPSGPRLVGRTRRVHLLCLKRKWRRGRSTSTVSFRSLPLKRVTWVRYPGSRLRIQSKLVNMVLNVHRNHKAYYGRVVRIQTIQGCLRSSQIGVCQNIALYASPTAKYFAFLLAYLLHSALPPTSPSPVDMFRRSDVSP